MISALFVVLVLEPIILPLWELADTVGRTVRTLVTQRISSEGE